MRWQVLPNRVPSRRTASSGALLLAPHRCLEALNPATDASSASKDGELGVEVLRCRGFDGFGPSFTLVARMEGGSPNANQPTDGPSLANDGGSRIVVNDATLGFAACSSISNGPSGLQPAGSSARARSPEKTCCASCSVPVPERSLCGTTSSASCGLPRKPSPGFDTGWCVEGCTNWPSSRRAGQLAALTPAERRVLRLLARRSSNHEIGAELFVSAETVKTHVGRILRKLGVSSRSKAARLAHDAGWAGAHRDGDA